MLDSLSSRCNQWLFAGLIVFALGSCEKPCSGLKAVDEECLPPAETITFGVYTADKASKVVEQLAPVLSDLEERMAAELGHPFKIRMRVAPDYSSGVADLVEGKVDFSRLGPASFITAKEMNPKLELLVMESNRGERTFKGVIAVRTDSPAEKLEDLRGASFAFGDPNSTIGRYLAQAELLRVGIDSNDLEDMAYLGRHDTVGMAVAAGQYAAGALKESTFNSLVEAGQPLRALATFDNVTKPWVCNPSLAPEIVEALRHAFFEMTKSEADRGGFLPATESDYDTIKVSMNEAQAF